MIQAAAVVPFDLFAPGSAGMLALFGARVSGLMLIAPVFAARTVPVMVRTALIVLFTLLMAPVARGTLVAPPVLSPTTFLSETMIGFAIGLGAALLVGAAESAGELLSIQIGLQGSAIVDPLSRQQSTAIGQFINLMAIALLLTSNGHLVMLDALAASLRHLPVGAPVQIEAGLSTMVSLGSTLFGLGLRFASPVIAVVLIANVALAVLGRAAPSLNIMATAFPVQILLGLTALMASIPFIGQWFMNWEQPYDVLLTRVMAALAGVGGR